MTLLAQVNKACDLLKLDTFTQLVGSGTDGANTMIALAQEAGEEIARRADWQALLIQATVSANPYTLPADFHRFTPGGGLRTALGVFLRPVQNSSEWALIKATPPSVPFCFIQAGKIEFSPSSIVPGVVFNYLSNAFIKPSTGANVTAWTADDNTTLFPERLLSRNIVWRYKRQKGLVYEDDLAEFEAQLAIEAKADRGAS